MLAEPRLYLICLSMKFRNSRLLQRIKMSSDNQHQSSDVSFFDKMITIAYLSSFIF